MPGNYQDTTLTLYTSVGKIVPLQEVGSTLLNGLAHISNFPINFRGYSLLAQYQDAIRERSGDFPLLTITEELTSLLAFKIKGAQRVPWVATSTGRDGDLHLELGFSQLNDKELYVHMTDVAQPGGLFNFPGQQLKAPEVKDTKVIGGKPEWETHALLMNLMGIAFAGMHDDLRLS